MKLELLYLMAIGPVLQGAQLRPETVAAWDQYVDRVVSSQGAALWLDQDPARLEQVRQGEVVTAPVGPHSPLGVRSGLIHHWIGGAFIRGARLNEVMNVVRDYARYPEYFSPNVASAQVIGRGESEDQFCLRLMNRNLLVKTAVEGEYRSKFVVLEGRRFAYSVARTTRVQEIEDWGRASEHRLPVGEGGGYIWRFVNITRYCERDGGVYIEAEAIALSREIPGSLKWVVEPYVRRLSRDSLVTSLRQTGDAVRGRAEVGFAGH